MKIIVTIEVQRTNPKLAKNDIITDPKITVEKHYFISPQISYL